MGHEQFTLVIGNKNYSSWSLRPWLALRSCAVPFQEVLIPLYGPDSKDRILKHSPSGKVPVLLHNDLCVWESLAICEYAAELFPNKHLWPENPADRALTRSICMEMHAGFPNLRKELPMNIRARISGIKFSPEAEGDIARVKEIWKTCRQRSKKTGKFLLGHFSIADAMFAPVVFRFQTYGVELAGQEKQYLETMLGWPAMREWQKAAEEEPYTIPQFERQAGPVKGKKVISGGK